MSHELKSLKHKSKLHKAVRRKALRRTAIAIKAIREQRELAMELDKRYIGELDIANRGAEEAMLHLAIVEANADDEKVETILAAHGVVDILP